LIKTWVYKLNWIGYLATLCWAETFVEVVVRDNYVPNKFMICFSLLLSTYYTLVSTIENRNKVKLEVEIEK
jgi:hypothetical protein